MRILTVSALVCTLTLASCGGFSGIGSGDSGLFPRGGLRGSSEEVSGIRFRSRLSATSEDDRSFNVVTRGASRDLVSASEAGRVEALRYCLNRFGGTDVDWVAGPDRPLEEIAIGEDGSLVLSGRCISR
ncbi:MAG: hypothetical protein WBA67_07715 [Jannaschia sp.]